jgi:ribosomal protein S18 acetylase RimI-like enzyme
LIEIDNTNIPVLELYSKLEFSVVGEKKGYYNNKNAILKDFIL